MVYLNLLLEARLAAKSHQVTLLNLVHLNSKLSTDGDSPLVHVSVLLHYLGKALQENNVLEKKALQSCQRMGVKLPCCLHAVLAAEEMLFALQLLGCAKHRPKLPGCPSSAGR